MGAEDGAVLKKGIEVLDELLCSDFALTKVVLMSFAVSFGPLLIPHIIELVTLLVFRFILIDE